MAATFDDSGAAATAAHVTYEANQIARNFACLGRSAAVTATAEHIRQFWAPYLRSVARRQARAHRERFSPIAADAIAMLDRSAKASGAG